VTLVAAYATSLIVIDFLLPLSDENSEDYTIRTRSTDHKKYISTLEWSDDGRHLLTASEDMIFVWNIDSNNEFQMIYSIPSEDEKITSCIFLPSTYVSLNSLNSSSNLVGNLRIAYSTYDNIYVWESDNNGKSMYSHYSSSNTGKISIYNKAHTGTICSLTSCIRLKPSVKNIANTTNDDFEIILASSSSTKENNLKLWNVNL